MTLLQKNVFTFKYDINLKYWNWYLSLTTQPMVMKNTMNITGTKSDELNGFHFGNKRPLASISYVGVILTVAE